MIHSAFTRSNRTEVLFMHPILTFNRKKSKEVRQRLFHFDIQSLNAISLFPPIHCIFHPDNYIIIIVTLLFPNSEGEFHYAQFLHQ
jgi:hypothetical protein